MVFTTLVQTKFRPYSLHYFSKYKIFQQTFKCLNAVFSKKNISCFEIRWPRLIWSIDVFFMHNASAVDIYRAQRKHINNGIWPMRISLPDSRRRYSKLYVISAGSHFTLRTWCSQAKSTAKLKHNENNSFIEIFQRGNSRIFIFKMFITLNKWRWKSGSCVPKALSGKRVFARVKPWRWKRVSLFLDNR